MKVNRLTDLTEFLNEERTRCSVSLKSASELEEFKSSDKNIIYSSSFPPEWSVEISSEHNLQLTLTKTSLEIFMQLQKVTTTLDQ